LEERGKNIEFIALARGIGIFLVVLGHTTVPEIRANNAGALALYRFIYAFHMPLYAMISGYLFEFSREKYLRRGYGVFVRGKARTLLLPYLTFSLISYVGIGLAFQAPTLASILSGGGYTPPTPASAAFQILTNIGHIDQHLWFLYALFFVFAISLPLKNYRIAIPLLCALYIFFVRTNALGETARSISYLLLYFTLGRQLDIIDACLARKKRTAALCAALFAVSYAALRLSGVSGVPRSILSVIAAVSGALIVLAIAAMLCGTCVARPIQLMSGYSYDIYLMHQPFITSGVGGILLKLTSLPYWIICCITLVLGIALPMLASFLVIRRVKPLRLLLLGMPD